MFVCKMINFHRVNFDIFFWLFMHNGCLYRNLATNRKILKTFKKNGMKWKFYFSAKIKRNPWLAFLKDTKYSPWTTYSVKSFGFFFWKRFLKKMQNRLHRESYLFALFLLYHVTLEFVKCLPIIFLPFLGNVAFSNSVLIQTKLTWFS